MCASVILSVFVSILLTSSQQPVQPNIGPLKESPIGPSQSAGYKTPLQQQETSCESLNTPRGSISFSGKNRKCGMLTIAIQHSHPTLAAPLNESLKMLSRAIIPPLATVGNSREIFCEPIRFHAEREGCR